MSSVNDSWNPDDGPPPTDEERAQAKGLADALAHGPDRRPRDPDVAALLDTALRVRATAHPDAARTDDAARRAVREVLHQDRPIARVFRLRWRVAVAVAAAGVVAIAVGIGTRGGDDRAPSSLSAELPPAFSEAVQPGAGAAPATRLYDRRLRLYRESYLRRSAR